MKIDNDLVDEIYLEALRERNKFEKESVEWYYFTGAIGMLESLQTIDKDIDLSNNNNSLKEYALNIIDDLEEDGANLTESSYVLQWKYDERPDVLVTLVLGDFEYLEDDKGDLH